MDLAPLYAIRLRTPRLELRLGSHDELVRLRELARAGVHPPEEMPFEVPWTDEPYSEGWVVAFHEQVLADWRPERWSLNLLVWARETLVGTQELAGTDFAATRAVHTGSWLGQRFQRAGIGTEMRSAALELAFRGLGAVVARSGWLDGNDASRRVAEKLGYAVVGRDWKTPRGERVGETRVELRREDWRPPFPVEIEGLEPALPLFGL